MTTSDETTQRCPQCQHTEFDPVRDEVHRCRRCRWMVRIDEYGHVRDWLDMKTAGRSRYRTARRL